MLYCVFLSLELDVPPPSPQAHVLPGCVYPGPPAGASHQMGLPNGPVLEMDWGN